MISTLKKSRIILMSYPVLGLLMAAAPTLGTMEEDLSALLESARVEMELPGLRAAVRFGNGEIVSASVGLADREAGIPLDNQAPMPGGSTGKTYVAAVAMLLVEEEVLALDDLASRWLKDKEWFGDLPNANEIQVRHLLSHSSGLSDYPGTRGYTLASIWRALRRGSIHFEPEELIRFTLKKKPLFPVGEGYSYTDIGYLVLGKLIEEATGEKYYDLVREKILEAHGLNEIVLQDRSILPDVVTGYMRGAPNLREDGSMKMDPSSEWTGGGLATNPTMLVSFLGLLAQGEIVSQDSLDQMVNSGWRDSATPNVHYGLGLFVYNDGKAFGHAGLWPGYRTDMLHYAPSNVSIAIQTNRDGSVDTGELVRRIANLVNADEPKPEETPSTHP
ncbi:MAG: serine hydrolase [Gammaproteobacteria bacterium]|nr:serine hydrolase [Gammaproteobacteria bacterium]